MEIPLKYALTQDMLRLIASIEVKRAALEKMQIPQNLISNLQRKSLLKSSLFSAKIEGNSLDISDVDNLNRFNPKFRERVEIENILSGFSFIQGKKDNIDIDFILDLHRIVMKNLTDRLGAIRREPSAIYNQSGFPVYIPPLPSQIQEFLLKLFAYVNDKDSENILIKAFVSHISFEKIHPFSDGNGRVGRLLLQLVLLKGGYLFNGLISLEEVLNERKEEYYAYLNKSDATSFIEFMLELLEVQVQKALEELSIKEYKKEDLLLPKRKEILDIIRDHEVVSLDFISRRFYKFSDRMIRYDLKKLENEGYIIKLGTTRGAMYRIK